MPEPMLSVTFTVHAHSAHLPERLLSDHIGVVDEKVERFRQEVAENSFEFESFVPLGVERRLDHLAFLILPPREDLHVRVALAARHEARVGRLEPGGLLEEDLEHAVLLLLRTCRLDPCHGKLESPSGWQLLRVELLAPLLRQDRPHVPQALLGVGVGIENSDDQR